MLRFAIRFLVCFGVLAVAFEASRGTAFERAVVERGIVAPTAGVLRVISPGVRADVPRRRIISGAARLHVTRGCEGVETLLLLVAAVLAFPASAKRRMLGLLLGSLLVYALTVARLGALVITLRYWPDGWEAMHGLLMPLAPVVVIAIYFFQWSRLASATPSAAAP